MVGVGRRGGGLVLLTENNDPQISVQVSEALPRLA